MDRREHLVSFHVAEEVAAGAELENDAHPFWRSDNLDDLDN
jgi:hypothetical protein